MLHEADELGYFPASGKVIHPYDRSAAGRVVVMMLTVGVGAFVLALIQQSGFDAWFLYIGLATLAVLTLLVYFYMLAAWKRSVELDFDQRVVVLRHMVYPVRFWDILPKSEARIPFSEIRDVETMNGKALRSFIVHTSRSRFVFSEYFESADTLASRLEKIATGNPELGALRRFSTIIMVAAACVLAGGLVVGLGFALGWI